MSRLSRLTWCLLAMGSSLALGFAAGPWWLNVSPLFHHARSPAAPTSDPAFDSAVYHDLDLRALGGRVPILRISALKPDDLDRDLKWLSDQGAQFLSAEQLHRHLAEGAPVADRSVLLAFDHVTNGFSSTVLPTLVRHRARALILGAPASGTDAPLSAEEIRRIDASGLVSFGVSESSAHPLEDPTVLNADRVALQTLLRRPVVYGAVSTALTPAQLNALKGFGFTMLLGRTDGPAEESTSILALNTYPGERLHDAFSDCNIRRALAPAAVVQVAIRKSPVRLQVGEYAHVPLGLVYGGAPTTRRSNGRHSVGDFVREARGVAGINGTFFADARIRSADNVLIGPSQTEPEGEFRPEIDAWRLSKLGNRPMVVWGPSQLAIVPFQPGSMNVAAPLRRLMPDLTNAFVAGAWLVRDGKPRSEDELKAFSVDNVQDPRRRAFLGVTADGEIVLGASRWVVTSSGLARAAAAAGVREAVLLDSGFSTSLVYNSDVIVTGHTARHIPSRPVPHAIVLVGSLAPGSKPFDPSALPPIRQASSGSTGRPSS